MEVDQHHFYAVKFHLKNHRDSKNKYNVMTGLNEARQCIRTVMAIMAEVAKNDHHASFGFIGANMEGESERYTKRFRVYYRFMTSYFDDSVFEHYSNYEKSAYMLLNKKQLAIEPELLDILVKGFHVLYPYFE